MKYRIEKDTLGEVKVPVDALYQAQTQRAVENFKFSTKKMPKVLIDALLDIKNCAALSNANLQQISKQQAKSIVDAIIQIKTLDYAECFPLDIFQTGSGTSTHMNVNEVIATVAGQLSNEIIHPNDIVNRGQSSNDVFPSAIQIAVVRETNARLLPAFDRLTNQLTKLAEKHQEHVKNARTHLMDATPITFAQEISCWMQQLKNAAARIQLANDELLALPLGGTAVGTGINSHSAFAEQVCRLLSEKDGIEWRVNPMPSVYMSAQEHTLMFASAIKNCAVALLKISNDLRWMNSGPVSGLNEIQMPVIQPGSSIMPAKVNPVIAEAVAMIAAEIIGNETSITVAAQSGNFQLNVMLPLIGEKLISSIDLLTNAFIALSEKVFNDLKINYQTTQTKAAANPILATALNQLIGYDLAAKIAKRAANENLSVLEVALQETQLDSALLKSLLDPLQMTNFRKSG